MPLLIPLLVTCLCLSFDHIQAVFVWFFSLVALKDRGNLCITRCHAACLSTSFSHILGFSEEKKKDPRFREERSLHSLEVFWFLSFGLWKLGFHSFIFHPFHVSICSRVGLKSRNHKISFYFQRYQTVFHPALKEACAKREKRVIFLSNSLAIGEVSDSKRGKVRRSVEKFAHESLGSSCLLPFSWMLMSGWWVCPSHSLHVETMPQLIITSCMCDSERLSAYWLQRRLNVVVFFSSLPLLMLLLMRLTVLMPFFLLQIWLFSHRLAP